MDRDEELNFELQKVRNAIREETAALQKNATGLWAGRTLETKDGGREGNGGVGAREQTEKLVRMLTERRQKLEKETADREREKEAWLPPSSSISAPSLGQELSKNRTGSLS
jgi:DNA-binding transcriptional MerR regulator